jgi:deoxyribonuclease IV
MKEKEPLLLGAHMSTAGGLHNAIQRGVSIGCTTIQIFTTNNRQWRSKPLTSEQIKRFKLEVSKSKLHTIVSHASYLVNLGSPHNIIQQKSIEALIKELERCTLLSIPYIVLHPGSHLDMDENTCIKQVAHNIDKVIMSAPSKPMILLEIMAGQGSTIGYSFEHLGQLRSASQYPNRIGFCLDICHAFAAGYDFTTQNTYDSFFNKLESIIGLSHVKVIHINDSKKALGSRLDRHEHIGQGKIGLETFRLLVNDKKLSHIPKILETPKESPNDDKHNLDLLKQLIEDEKEKSNRPNLPL